MRAPVWSLPVMACHELVRLGARDSRTALAGVLVVIL